MVDGAEGNATVTPASQPVTAGDTPPVTVEWSGLIEGARYLGVLSYSNGSGAIGTTMVSVTG